MTVPAEVPVAVKFCAMKAPAPDDAPVAPDCTAVHEKEVPVTLLDNAMAVAFSEQMSWLEGVAVIIGFGFTEMTTFTGFPEQPFNADVMV